MSAGNYGTFKIGIYKDDGSADSEMAKKVFDWCGGHYTWFADEEENRKHFNLEGNKILANMLSICYNALKLQCDLE